VNIRSLVIVATAVLEKVKHNYQEDRESILKLMKLKMMMHLKFVDVEDILDTGFDCYRIWQVKWIFLLNLYF
jgi:hypothetical protein